MTKRKPPKRPNPVAKELRTSAYRKRIVESDKTYKRNPKHRGNSNDKDA